MAAAPPMVGAGAALPELPGQRQRERVQDLLGDLVEADVVMQEQVEAEIIGGVIARVGDRLIDGSTRTRLQIMREALARPPLEAVDASWDGS